MIELTTVESYMLRNSCLPLLASVYVLHWKCSYDDVVPMSSTICCGILVVAIFRSFLKLSWHAFVLFSFLFIFIHFCFLFCYASTSKITFANVKSRIEAWNSYMQFISFVPVIFVINCLDNCVRMFANVDKQASLLHFYYL